MGTKEVLFWLMRGGGSLAILALATGAMGCSSNSSGLTVTTTDAGPMAPNRTCQSCGDRTQPCCGAGAVANRTCSSGLTCTAPAMGGGGEATCQ